MNWEGGGDEGKGEKKWRSERVGGRAGEREKRREREGRGDEEKGKEEGGKRR